MRTVTQSLLCGIAVATSHVAFSNSALCQTFSVLATVPGGPTIGAISGNTLYGTVPSEGDGTLFSLTTSGTYTLLHGFNGGTDGSAPNGQFALDATGTLYGTASGGGANGDGTIWQYSPTGVFTNVHSFGDGEDGTVPTQGPVLGKRGEILGNVFEGGSTDNGGIFAYSRKGHYKMLYSFLSKADGHCPRGGVAYGNNGFIYGTTIGNGGGGNPTGSVWKFARGSGLKTLYVFQDGADGEWPDQAPVVDAAGNIYGTTHTQNGNNFDGAIWKLTPGGSFTVLHSLVGAVDGSIPNSPLVINTDGNLYGTASAGGAYGWGTVFRITPAGNFTVEYSFQNNGDGAVPTGNLVHDAAGAIYGGTDYGEVFKITP